MSELLLVSAEYSGYISIGKFVTFLVLFFLWLVLLSWVYEDAKAVGTKETTWAGLIFGAGALAALMWLIIPVFVVGMLLYVAIVGTTGLAYVMHRNARVLEFDRILTAEHIKGLLSASEQKKLNTMKHFAFVTANNNEIPMPQPKTPDFFGYRAAYDVINDASKRRASDITFSPSGLNYNVTYLIDGAAIRQPSMERERAKYFINFIKNLADLNIKEKRKPQKGRFSVRQNKESSEWKVTTAGSTAGEQLKLKFAAKGDVMKLNELGLSAEQYDQIKQICQSKQGLFIVSGPKKSGMTTTFYSLLRNHDAFLNSIDTLERQPSADLPNINQNVFALSDTGTTTFSKRLQSIMRMAPDIIGVADYQDSETGKIICEAAKADKLVYVTFEADNVAQTLVKWMQLTGDKNLAIEPLLAITNQRLLRKLCDDCKQAYTPNQDILRKFNLSADKVKVLYRVGKVQYDKHGKSVTCEACQGTGFIGRVGVFEVIIINDELRKIIKQSNSLSEINAQFRHAKMVSIQQQTLRMVINGSTSINEMVRVFSASEKQRTKKRERKE